MFKKERGFNGEVRKYKARIIARGFTQEEGVDYANTFSPTVRFESIKLMLAEAAAKDMQTAQMDVTTASLYADLDEEVYMEIPEGMFGDADMSGQVLLRITAFALADAASKSSIFFWSASTCSCVISATDATLALPNMRSAAAAAIPGALILTGGGGTDVPRT